MVQERDRAHIPYGWMRLLYVCTAFMGISTGLIILLAPERFARNIIGVPYALPAQDRSTFGFRRSPVMRGLRPAPPISSPAWPVLN